MRDLEFPELDAVLADLPDLPELKFDFTELHKLSRIESLVLRDLFNPFASATRRVQGSHRTGEDARLCVRPQRPKGECMNT